MTAAPPAPPTNNPSFQAIMAADTGAPTAAPIEKAPETKAPETKETPTEAPKQIQNPKSPDGDKKGPRGLEKLSSIKKPDAKEEPKQDPKTTEADPDANKPLTNEERRRFGELRKIEDQWKEYNEKQKPEFEKLRTEHDQLKARQLKDDERQRLERYEQIHAEDVLINSPDFQRNITMPIKNLGSKIMAAAKNAGLDPDAQSRLLDAADEPDDFKRNKAMRAILATSSLEEPDVEALFQGASSAAQKLHDEWYPKEAQMRADARNKSLVERNRQSEESKLKEIQQKEAFQKSQNEVLDILSKDKLKELFDNKDLVIDGVHMADAMKQAQPSDDPNDRAFEVMAAAGLPYAIEEINRLYAKVADLEKGHTQANGAKPKLSSGLSPTPPKDESQKLKFEDVFSTGR